MAKGNMTDAELATFMKTLKSWFKSGEDKAAKSVMRRGGKVKRKRRYAYADGGTAQTAVMPQGGSAPGASSAVSSFRAHQGLAPNAAPMSGSGGGYGGSMGGGYGGSMGSGGGWSSGIDPAAMAAARAQMMAPRAPAQAQTQGVGAPAAAAPMQWMMGNQNIPQGMGEMLAAYGFTGKNTPFGIPVTQSGYKRGGTVGGAAEQALRIARKK